MPDSEKFGLLLNSQQRVTELVTDLVQELRAVQTINERLALLAHRLTVAEDYLKQLETFKRDCVVVRKECSALIGARLEDIVTKREKRGEELHASQTKCLERYTDIMRQLHEKSGAIYERINVVHRELSAKIDHTAETLGRDYDCARDQAAVSDKALSDKLASFATDAAGKLGKFAGIIPLIVGILMALLQILIAHSNITKAISH